jgi:hypothetical protein
MDAYPRMAWAQGWLDGDFLFSTYLINLSLNHSTYPFQPLLNSDCRILIIFAYRAKIFFRYWLSFVIIIFAVRANIVLFL